MDKLEKDPEKGTIEAVYARMIHALKGQKERDKDDHKALSVFKGLIPSTIESLIPPSPYHEYIPLGRHHHNPNTNDDRKERYMYDLFQRLKSPPDEIGRECVNRMYANYGRITACYKEIPSNKYFTSFQWGMVMDACYILELIQKWSDSENDRFLCDRRRNKSLVSLEEKHDLVRLDNQVPFFLLQDIFECTILKIQPTTTSLPNLILAFLKEIIPFEANVVVHDDDTHNYEHILDLLYHCYKPQDGSSPDRLSRVTTMFSATQLAKAGVKFNPNPDHKWKLDIKFTSSWGNATLTLPAMRIEESTAIVLCNLVAYERVFPQVGDYITSYVFGMKMLLDTKEDVLKLVESKICRNPSGNQYMVDLIHGLCKDVVLTDFLYAEQWQSMGNYCDSWLGWTRRTYFSGAWSYIASISGLILFFLTAIQTYSSIRTL